MIYEQLYASPGDVDSYLIKFGDWLISEQFENDTLISASVTVSPDPDSHIVGNTTVTDTTVAVSLALPNAENVTYTVSVNVQTMAERLVTRSFEIVATSL